MNGIEICAPEPNSAENGLRSFEKLRKAFPQKKVRFAEAQTMQPEATAFKLCQFNLNIKHDIPEKFQTIVYHLYYLCVLHNIINLGNVLFAVLVVKTPIAIASTAVYCLMSLTYSYLVWFQCAYKTFTLKSKAYFITFLVTFFLQFVFSCVQTIGIHNAISAGFLSALERSPDIQTYANFKIITELIIAAVCGCGALVDVILIVMIFNMYSKIINFCKITVPESEIIKPA